VIDEHLFSGAMVLAQDQIQPPRPFAVEFAVTSVITISFRMLLLVLFPEELQGHIRAFELRVNGGVIWLGPLAR
jgi:hypothetical protein